MRRKHQSILVPLAVLAVAALPALSRRSDPKDEQARQQAKLFQKKLDKNKQILHALDRLTFGPRPGDVERVRKIGLKKWIEEQLNPDGIAENTYLEGRLEPLESLRMSPMEAVQHYPPPQLIKAVAEGRQPMPEDPVLRASVERLVARYRVKKGDSDAKADANNSEDLEPVRPLNEILTRGEINTLRNGKPDEKRALLTNMPAAKLEDVVIALPRGLRQGLFAFAPTDL